MTDNGQQADGPYVRDQLACDPGLVHLYSGAEAPAIQAHKGAALRYLIDKSDGDAGRRRNEAELERCRTLLAGMIGGKPESVALLGNASDALHRLTSSIDYRPGDNVVTTDLEFPSGILSLLSLRSRGVEVRIVPAQGWAVRPADFERLIDRRTRVVVASHVSYSSGARIEPGAIRDIANRVGAAFILDATQSLGVVRVDAEYADAIVSSSYKWLLGPHGIGLVYITRPEMFVGDIDGAGWRSVPDLFVPERNSPIKLYPDARRFELGFPSFPSVYLLAESMALLRTVDPLALESYALGLSGLLVDELVTSGFDLMTPRNPEARGTNICVVVPDGQAVAAKMLADGIMVWGGDSRVRFSVHGFATMADIEAGIAALQAAT